jgi:5'-nucleotidase
LNQANGPFGGAARMNWLIQRERAHADRVLHIDSGDCFQGAPIFNFFSGEAEVRALGWTGVDAVAVGNHEFDRGARNFVLQYSRWATFPVLAANYVTTDPTNPGSAGLANLVKPYTLFNLRGLKVAVIGFGNTSTITSLFDQPNAYGVAALNTRQTAQYYIDEVQALGADVVVGVTHLGLTEDQDMIARTTGFDVVLGGHLHIVLDPPEQIPDCQPVDAMGRHFVPEEDTVPFDPSLPEVPAQQQIDGLAAVCDPTVNCCDQSGVCRPGFVAGQQTRYWTLAPGYHERICYTRPVVLQHSGAFMKYLGRLDLVLSNDPSLIGEARLGDAATSDDPNAVAQRERNRFELIGHRYTLFPVDSTVPEEPTMAQMLEPYARALDTAANLDNIVGYAPAEVSRTNANNGDSQLGNLVTTAMWQRLGVQTDFALTNTLGIRDNIPPGAVTIDQVYNVFPFDNSITTLQLSGFEVQEMFDFLARRSAGRGCNSQGQISGARVIMDCAHCDRDLDGMNDSDGMGGTLTSCATAINIGLARTEVPDPNQPGQTIPTGVPMQCATDSDCNPTPIQPDRVNHTPVSLRQSLCDTRSNQCMQPITLEASYALAANDYIAAGGSGFFVLQRNTTQVNTGVQLRDSLIDFVEANHPCGWDAATEMAWEAAGNTPTADSGLRPCTTDSDCGDSTLACSCPEHVSDDMACNAAGMASHDCSDANGNQTGRCVLAACRDAITAIAVARCPSPTANASAPTDWNACLCEAESRGLESCRLVACLDQSVGAVTDGRIHMVSQ